MSEVGKRSEITVPGLIVTPDSSGSKKVSNRFRVQMFTISPDDDNSYQIEALYNRSLNEEIQIVSEHKFTFQNSFHIVLTYIEPVPKVPATKEKPDV